uniref:Uncharacterized protein n=1 Tax=Timema douglasi TaxID=61478 RepID=A0A7R8Z574_TIMDO|nr:unnamed protein product [Timema douglasi]
MDAPSPDSLKRSTSNILEHVYRKLKKDEPTKLSISIPSFNDELGLKLKSEYLQSPKVYASQAGSASEMMNSTTGQRRKQLTHSDEIKLHDNAKEYQCIA